MLASAFPGMPEAAVAKYTAVANVYAIRGEANRAGSKMDADCRRDIHKVKRLLIWQEISNRVCEPLGSFSGMSMHDRKALKGAKRTERVNQLIQGLA